MDARTSEDERLKELMKAAVVELLEERHDLVLDLLTEALEDIGLSRAIEEGVKTPAVGRDEVLQLLDRE
ncbi:MAG TPA: hypothetical protein VF121_03225 [Thermoanaerobaculia bacterium]|nr:hypothetical protein [Thermoanaerobaculia bacterium]